MGILEAGHYYESWGPTKWSVVGWEVMQRIKQDKDETMLFIDDVHGQESVPPQESTLEKEDLDFDPDHIVRESEVKFKAWEILDILHTFPKKKRPKKDRARRWRYSGNPITTSQGEPNCLLLDAGLTLLKREYGFKEGVNILPRFYEEQQKNLLHLVEKAIPDFHLQCVFYDLEGNYWSEP